jgi:hypothetical protein
MPALTFKVTHDPARQTLLVWGLPHCAWMLFEYGHVPGSPDLRCTDLASNINYHSIITGASNPSWKEVNAAWDVARDALMQLCVDPSRVPTATHAPKKRINGNVALVLATEDRIAKWGGFTGEREHLPVLINQLNVADRKLYDRRKRGLVVL